MFKEVNVLKWFNQSIIAIAFISSLAGCAGVGTVSESDRVKSDKYDGVWIVEIQKAATLQLIQGWQMSCGDMRRSFAVLVKDGMIQLNNDGKQIKTAVAENGRFKLTIPLGDIASESGTSDIIMGNRDVKIFLRGTLKDFNANGHITYGIAELGYGGCTAKTLYKRSDARA